MINACRDRTQCLRLLFLCILLPLNAMAQSPQPTTPEPASPPLPRSIEDLNLKGAAASDPLFSDSILGLDTPIRTVLFRHGLLFRMEADADYIQNTLAPPAAADAQTYIGQRPFGAYSINPVLTADLRQFGLRGAQLNINGHLQQGSWDQAQPTAWAICNLYVYKEFAEDRAELQFGYIATDFQFIGLQVGGQVASGAQGVYAVLPYEVGISYAPLTAPAVTFKYRWHSGAYLKAAAQRSSQPGSEQDALKRDAVGLRFLPHGDKLVLIGEVGINRPAEAGKLQEWYRAGYIVNNTPYTSLRTGLKRSGNYSGYLLADHQVWQPEQANPGRGIYIGGSAMVVPADLNIYRLYDEARIYDEAPFHNRPADFASIVASYTAFSQDDLHNLAAAGKSYSRSSNSVTGSYTLHLAPGTYIGLGLSYVNGPAVTPKSPSALTFTVQTSLFF